MMPTSDEIRRLVAAGHEWSSGVDDCAIPDIRRISTRSAIAKIADELGFELPPAYLDIACEIQGFYPKRHIFIVWDPPEIPVDEEDKGEPTYMVLRTFLVIAGSESGDEFGAEFTENGDVGNGVSTFAFYRGQLPDDYRDLFPIACDYRSNIVCLDFGEGQGVLPSVVYYDRSFPPESAVFPVAPSFETFLDTLTESSDED
jgi:hypothetical protein